MAKIVSWRSSETFAISKPDRYPVTKCIQKIVLQFFVFVSNPKTLDLLNKVVRTSAAFRDAFFLPSCLVPCASAVDNFHYPSVPFLGDQRRILGSLRFTLLL